MDLEKAKKEVARILFECGILPEKQGRVILNVSPEGSISSVEVQVTYK